MQAFAPLDISDFDDNEPDTGFYAGYQRTYLSVNRPNPQGRIFTERFPTGSDWQSGNLFNGGYMGEDGAGWDLMYQKTSGSFFSDGNGEGVEFPLFTTTTAHVLQINRVFRQRLSRGGYIEPYFGVGYTFLGDKSVQDIQATFPDPADPTATIDGNSRVQQDVKNSIVGGQVGFRLSNKFGRYRWGSNVNLAGGYNTQSYLHTENIFLEDGDDGALAFFDENRTTLNSTSFTPSLNASCELAYQLTRDVSLKIGGRVSYIWDGVNRANTLGADEHPLSPVTLFPRALAIDEQAMTIAGFSAGIEWRR